MDRSLEFRHSNERITYTAANGHLVATDRESYDRGTTWNAQHSEECSCVGETLPNW
jgi:hypothetical protein